MLSALLRSSLRTLCHSGAGVGRGDMPSTGMRPGEVVLAPSIKYLAPVVGTSNRTRLMNLKNEPKAMVISIVFPTAILLLSEP